MLIETSIWKVLNISSINVCYNENITFSPHLRCLFLLLHYIGTLLFGIYLASHFSKKVEAIRPLLKHLCYGSHLLSLSQESCATGFSFHLLYCLTLSFTTLCHQHLNLLMPLWCSLKRLHLIPGSLSSRPSLPLHKLLSAAYSLSFLSHIPLIPHPTDTSHWTFGGCRY